MPNALNMLPLSGKVALVTDGSRNIGAAIARRLAGNGASVALTYGASAASAAGVVQAIKAAGGTGMAILTDSADARSVRAAIQQTVLELGRLDILVNNAGIAIIRSGKEGGMDDIDCKAAVNVQGLLVAIQEAVPYLKEGARIINIGSINSEYVPCSGGALYVRTRAAVAGLTKMLAQDLVPRGITINNIMPGPADIGRNLASGELAQEALEYIALQRYACPEQIAELVAFLAMPGTRFFTTACLAMDGYCSA